MLHGATVHAQGNMGGAHRVTLGYTGLHGGTQGYMGLYPQGYTWLRKVTYGYTGKHGATQGCMRVTYGHTGLDKATECCMGLHRVTWGYTGLQSSAYRNLVTASLHFSSVITTSSPTDCVNNLIKTFFLPY